MALIDELRSLRDRALADLKAAHDYYTDTKIAWDIVRNAASTGTTFAIRNTTTGTVTTQIGKLVRHKAGDTIEIPEPYHRETWELICKLVAGISDAPSQSSHDPNTAIIKPAKRCISHRRNYNRLLHADRRRRSILPARRRALP